MILRRTASRILDEYLVASACIGDRAAFDRLAERWYPKLLTHAYRLTGDHEMARDAVQDGWADIVKGLPRLQDTAAFPAWAYRIVTRRVADRIKRVQRERNLSARYTAEPKSTSISTEMMEAKADAAPLMKAMMLLSTDQRATIALFYLEGFTVAEIATALSVPSGTVKTRLMNARQKLRVSLEEGTSYE